MKKLWVDLVFSLLNFGFGRGFSAHYEGLTQEHFNTL